MDDGHGGISARSREQLARLTARGRHIVTLDDAVDRLELGREEAKLMARWTEQRWLRRVRGEACTWRYRWTWSAPTCGPLEERGTSKSTVSRRFVVGTEKNGPGARSPT